MPTSIVRIEIHLFRVPFILNFDIESFFTDFLNEHNNIQFIYFLHYRILFFLILYTQDNINYKLLKNNYNLNKYIY